VLQQIVHDLAPSEQLELFNDLRRYLIAQELLLPEAQAATSS